VQFVEFAIITIMNKSLSVPGDAYHAGDSGRKLTKMSPPASSNVAALANVKYEHLVAGISGGVASTLALHPLDLLKVRLAGICCLC